MNIARLLKTPSIRTVWYYAVSGTFFAVATLFMARVFTPTDFGVVALAIALTNVGIVVSSAGLGGVILRHPVRLDAGLRRRAFSIVAIAGLALAAFGWWIYSIEKAVVLAVVAAVIAGGMALLGLVPIQKAHRFHVSVPLTQTGNLALILCAATLLLVPQARVVWLPTTFVAIAFGCVAVWAWNADLQQAAGGEGFERHGHDAVHFTLLAGADELMWQLERVMIPLLLSIEDLAVFAVIGAIAIAPYHMLAAAANATLIPRLRSESTKHGRRSLMVHEAGLMVGLAILGGAVIVLCMPPLMEWYLGPKIPITQTLLLSAIAGGTCRIFAAIARAPAAAFGTSEEIRRISAAAWFAVAVGIATAWALSGFGLAGLITGVALGWLVRGGIAIGVTWHHLAERDQ
jgi:O-antigen/teichoic acid export membrane protein